MKINSIIFDSELEFRKYIIKKYKNISKIYIFEDTLDCTIFFYCFFSNNLIIASKEPLVKGFSYYNNIYTNINKALKLNTNIESNSKVLKIKKK